MKFRRLKSHQEHECPGPSEEATKAFEESGIRLEEIIQRWPDIMALTASLRRAREENNFQRRIQATLTGMEKE